MGRYAERLILFIIDAGVSFVTNDFWEGFCHLEKLWIARYPCHGDIQNWIEKQYANDNPEAEGEDDDQ